MNASNRRVSRHRSAALGLGVALVLAHPGAVFGQDSDSDGAPNATDVFPCDGSRASVSYYPSQTSSALLVYEDQWPDHTDLDFNDVALRVHYRLELNAAGNVVQLHGVVDPVAIGGDLSNGLGLALPSARDNVTVRRRVGGGTWQTLTLESDASATALLSQNLRELYQGASGRINSPANQARLDGQRLEIEVSFTSPAPIDVAQAPFDLFIFRSGDLGHQIHFPQYGGTGAFRGSLLNSGQDISTPTRRFVTGGGVPAALNLQLSNRYPLEGVGIAALFPEIVGFASTGGAQNASFFTSNVVPAQGHDVAAPALPSVAAPSTACSGPTIQSFAFTGSPQTWTVPAGVGSVRIEAAGASGGRGYAGALGGRGALIAGTFAVSPGQVLTIVVGGRGGDASNVASTAGGGGGGGSFISSSGTPLLIAGGGGGGSYLPNTTGSSGNVGTAGGFGGYPTTSRGIGQGGYSDNSGGGGLGAGGGGWLSAGLGNLWLAVGGGAAGGAGGPAYQSYGGTGGFGGGGGSMHGGGGGGGYSGGNGGSYTIGGGGGGSYNAGIDATASAGVQSGDGAVTISWGN
jgi:LruC domain-containing protein